MAEQLNRIHGTELEYSMLVPIDGELQQLESRHVVNNIAGFMNQRPHHDGGNSNFFLANGARFYRDVGERYEYSTPEDDSFLGTVANEIAGDQIVHQALHYPVNLYGRKIKTVERLRINRRVIDDMGNSWGYHESYNTTIRPTIETDKLHLLVAHMATRNIFCGAGQLRLDGSYHIAQKARSLNITFSNGTQREKPLINTRNQPHAGVKDGHRFHLTSGDANMSPWSTRMKLATTSMIFRLMEHDVELSMVFLDQAYRVAVALSDHKNINSRIKLENGSSTAAEISLKLVKAAQDLSKQVTFPEEEQWALDEWERVCHDVIQDPKLLADRVDWATRLYLLNRAKEKKGYGWASPALQLLDNAYDEIGGDSIADKLRQTTWSNWMPSEELIASRIHTPPESTRAAARGYLIKHLAQTGLIRTVDWQSITTTNHTFNMYNPRNTKRPNISAYFRDMNVTEPTD